MLLLLVQLVKIVDALFDVILHKPPSSVRSLPREALPAHSCTAVLPGVPLGFLLSCTGVIRALPAGMAVTGETTGGNLKGTRSVRGRAVWTEG